MKTLIIAPHVDDETIGCWSVLNDFHNRSIDVAWGYELTDERLAEAAQIPNVNTRMYGFDQLTPHVLSKYDEIYVPSRRDWHHHHRETSARFRRYATHFYSVDMIGGKPLCEQDAALKKSMLDECFPSQKDLWKNNAKYYLFEAIQRDDISVYARILAEFYTEEDGGAIRRLQITVPVEYQKTVADMMREFNEDKNRNMSDREIFQRILEIIPTGKVLMKNPIDGICYEAEN